jgi:hypothetical protein
MAVNLEIIQTFALLPLQFVSLLFPWWLKPLGWHKNAQDMIFFARVLYLSAYTSSLTALTAKPPASTPRRGGQQAALWHWRLVHVVDWMDDVGTTLLWALFLFLLFFTASIPILCITTQFVLLFNRIFATPPPPQNKKTQVIIDETDPQYGMTLRQRKGKEVSKQTSSSITTPSTTTFSFAPSLTDEEQLRYEELIHSPVAQNLRMVAILPHRIAVAAGERFVDYVRYRWLRP